MTNKYHDEFENEENHHIQAFSYETQADRLAATGYEVCPGEPPEKPFDVDDVGKIAKQENTNPSDEIVTFWVLTNHSPVTWAEITNKTIPTDLDVKVSVSSNDSTAGFLQEKLTASNGSNTTNPIELKELNDSGDEDLNIQFDSSKINHDSLINSGGAKHTDWSQPGAGTIDPTNYVSGTGVFGTEFEEAESLSESSTTSSTPQLKVSLTTGNVPAGRYRIGYSYRWRHNSTGSDFEGEIIEDSSTQIMLHRQEPKDSGADQAHRVAGFANRTLSAGIHTFDLNWSENNGSTASIADARLEFWRLT